MSNFGSNKVNEARFRYTYDVVDFYSPLTAPNGAASRTPDFSTAPVTVTYTGVGNLGTNPGFPQNLVEKRAQWVDHFSIVSGSHQFKTGVDIIGSWRFVTFFNNFPGTYTFAQGTRTPFNANDPATFPFQYTQNFGDSGLNFNDAMVGVFAQDDWEVRARSDAQRRPALGQATRSSRGTTTTSRRAPASRGTSAATRRTVIRGNTGDLLRHARVVARSTASRTSGRSARRRSICARATRCFRRSQPLQCVPERLDDGRARDRLRAGLRGRRLPGQHRRPTSSDRRPYFFNTNLGVQHEVRTRLGGVGRLHARVYGYDLLVTWDINAPPFFALGPGQTRTAAQANALRPLGVPNRTGGDYGIPFTGFRSLYLQFNGGHTEYHALKLGVTKRFSNRYAAQLNYTYGHARGDVDNFRLNTAFMPGLTAIDGDRSYQWGAQRHRCAAPLRGQRHLRGCRSGFASAGFCLPVQDFRTPASSAWTRTATALPETRPAMRSRAAMGIVPRA